MSNLMNNVEGSGLFVAEWAEPRMTAVRLHRPASVSSGRFPGIVSARGVLGLLLVAALAGCAAVGPDYEKPAMSVPDHWGPGHPRVDEAGQEGAAGVAGRDGADASTGHASDADKSGEPGGVSAAHEGDKTRQAIRDAKASQIEMAIQAEKDAISQAPALARWWEKLDDPLLNALMNEAVAGSLDVATAKAKVREARASYRQSGGALWPSVTGSTSATRAKSTTGGSAAAAIGMSQGVYNQYQAGFDASWELDLFGANRRTLEAARYGLDAAEEELRGTLLTLVGDVASNYVAARGYQARMALARRTAVSQRETARLTQLRFRAGSTSAVDVANAAGQAAATEANIPQLETSWAESVHRLSVLTGQPPMALAARMDKEVAIPTPKLPVGTGIPADILNRRPDVRKAERQYAQATASIGAAEAARYPNISLTGSISTAATRIGDLGKHSSIGWSFGPSLSVPIFNGGKLAAAVDVARAQRDQYFVAYQSSVLTALEEVENAIVGLSRERVRQGSLAEAAQHYRKAASLARSLFRSGASSFLDLLEAERSLYSAEDSLLQSQVSSVTDYIALNKALGGGWDGEVDASEPVVIPAAKKQDVPEKNVR